MPTATPPNQPQYPWTEIAPQGSSTWSTRSLKSTPPATMTRAMRRIRTAAFAPTKAHGAVIATSPASMPLQAIEMSGLPNRKYQSVIADAAPATAARFVLMAMTEMRRSVAPSVDPGLKPIHPNRRMKVPVTTNTMLCAGNARGFPSQSYLPTPGPKSPASPMAQNPPTPCTTVEPAKSQYPWPSPSVVPHCDIHPPPQTQQPNIGYRIAPMKSSQSRNAPNVIR